jgi:dipeptidyl-peptidase-4
LDNIPKLATSKKGFMRLSWIACYFLFVVPALAQKEITIDDFTTRNTFLTKTVSGINWMADGKFYTSLKDNKIVRFDITSGSEVETIYDGKNVIIDSYSFSQDEKKLLIATDAEPIYRRSSKASFIVYDIQTRSARPLSSAGKQSYATFSPDGRRAAFVRANNLFVVDLAAGKEIAMTTDGKPNSIINGSTDWVYEEELGFTQAFAWSPDGKRIAYYRFDESAVREYNLQKWNRGALYPEDYRYKYPKAGEANSIVEVWIAEPGTSNKVKVDLGKETDIYVPRMTWTLDGALSLRLLNRLQNTMQLLHADAATGTAKVIITEKNERYYDIDHTDELVYLEDGKRFIISSERTGYKHFYLYRLDGTLERALTSGNFEAVQLVGVDQKAGMLYYLSTEGNYLSRTLYSIDFSGKKKTRLSGSDGARSVNMSNDARYYIDYYSTPKQPYFISLYQTQGNKQLKVLETNEELARKYNEYGAPDKEYFQYTAGDGVTKVDGYLMKPSNMQAGEKYPVLVYQYSGPRSNTVSNSFSSGSTQSWHHMMVQKGVIVAVVDTRGTGSRGEVFAKQTYKQLGKMELEDLLAVGKYLGGLEFVDRDRLGVWGWSYGGYMASLVMTKGAGIYKVGIAGAPVTSWRFYDTIYTERFLQRPQDNPEGYDKNSPLTYADKLQGHFLLIHGTGDDNVHFQNSVALEDALIRAGKQFRSHFYPDQAHGFRGAQINHHRWTLMTNFLLENL